jgi:transposase
MLVELGMRPPICVPALSPAERDELTDALRSKDAFALPRAQILLASAQGHKSAEIAATFGCSDQTVRNVIRDFACRGRAVLIRRSTARTDQQPVFDAASLAALPELLPRSPRDFGKTTSLWSLGLVATVCYEQRLTPYVVSIETIRKALTRLKVGWKRAKHWITSPDPEYAAKKAGCVGCRN